jgi:hypothetical protein
MSIEFEKGWLQHTVDHLVTETVAKRLIRSASRALSQNNSIDVIVWRQGAEGSHVLRITKGLHQPEGPLSDLMHITMRLYIPGSKQGDLVADTHFEGKFHLYTKILNPSSTTKVYTLQPTRLSYQTFAHAFNVGPGFIPTDIPNADPITSDMATPWP